MPSSINPLRWRSPLRTAFRYDPSMAELRIERQQPDRRRRPTAALSRFWLRGRRRDGRRVGETTRIYVDRYTMREAGLFIALITLSLMDLVMTLAHLNAGGTEANPIMAWFVQHTGTVGFGVAKMSGTALGALLLLIHVRFKGVARILQLLVVGYLVLLVWHGVVRYHLEA